MDTTPTPEQLASARIFPEAAAHNARQLYYIRSVTLSVAGSLAGVLGLRTYLGFVLYVAVLLLVNVVTIGMAKFKPTRYFAPFALDSATPGKGGVEKAVTGAKWLVEGAQEFAFSYVLWWTLWSAVVHGELLCKSEMRWMRGRQRQPGQVAPEPED